MLLHWNRKHNQACYVPSLSDTDSNRQYKYGNNIILGTGNLVYKLYRSFVQGLNI